MCHEMVQFCVLCVFMVRMRNTRYKRNTHNCMPLSFRFAHIEWYSIIIVLWAHEGRFMWTHRMATRSIEIQHNPVCKHIIAHNQIFIIFQCHRRWCNSKFGQIWSFQLTNWTADQKQHRKYRDSKIKYSLAAFAMRCNNQTDHIFGVDSDFADLTVYSINYAFIDWASWAVHAQNVVASGFFSQFSSQNVTYKNSFTTKECVRHCNQYLNWICFALGFEFVFYYTHKADISKEGLISSKHF